MSLKRIFIKFKSLFEKKDNHICSFCKTGAYFYKLDRSGIFCPYIECCTGSGCAGYVLAED